MPLSPDLVHANLARIREEIGPGPTIVAATKYVTVEDLPALAEAGVDVVGENRLQDLLAKQARHASLFRWHFIGHLQSRKARDVSRVCDLLHSLDSLSAARRVTIPALVEVNLSGEDKKGGVAPEAAVFLDDFAPNVAAARSIGIHGIVVADPLVAMAELDQLVAS